MTKESEDNILHPDITGNENNSKDNIFMFIESFAL